MKYKNIKNGIFVSRPNRFIAHVKIDGKEEVCHVKNTGRCKELLFPGVSVLVEVSDNLQRKTKYDLVSVYKGDRMCMLLTDSAAIRDVLLFLTTKPLDK